MNLKLKSIKDYPSMSEETDCFQADLWVDNKKVAHIKNDGRGGCDNVYAYDGMRKKLAEVEAYCEALPKVKFRNSEMDNDLELETARLMNEWRNNKVFRNKLLIEKDNKQYEVKFTGTTITKMLKTPQGINTLDVNIKKYQLEGYTILNTNLGSLLK